MPVTPSAAKALRRDQRRQQVNIRLKTRMNNAIRKAREELTDERVKEAYSAIDRAAKKGVIHQNRASRLKSRLSNFVSIHK